jgi:hypothetical protein
MGSREFQEGGRPSPGIKLEIDVRSQMGCNLRQEDDQQKANQAKEHPGRAITQ